MTFRDSWKLALKSIVAHKTRSFLTVCGIAIGIVAVVLLTALGEGAREFVRQEFDSLGHDFIVAVPGRTETEGGALNPMSGNTIRDLTLEDARAVLRRCPLVDEVMPAIIGAAPADSGRLNRDVSVFGTTAAIADIHNLKVISGRFLPRGFDSSVSECVIGSDLEKALFPDRPALGQILRISGWRLRVVGVVMADGNSMGLSLNEFVYVPIRTGMKMFNLTGIIRLVIRARSFDSLASAREQAREVLIDRHDGEEDFTLLEPTAMQDAFLGILGTMTTFLVSVAAISLGVAGLGVTNLMLVTVSERRHEIGLMKALGARTAQITRLFLSEAAVLSFLGGALGLLFGSVCVWSASWYFPKFPLAIPLWAVVSSLILSGLTGAVFGTWPALKAARVDPVEALSS